jgi:hypothetical protein
MAAAACKCPYQGHRNMESHTKQRGLGRFVHRDLIILLPTFAEAEAVGKIKRCSGGSNSLIIQFTCYVSFYYVDKHFSKK